MLSSASEFNYYQGNQEGWGKLCTYDNSVVNHRIKLINPYPFCLGSEGGFANEVAIRDEQSTVYLLFCAAPAYHKNTAVVFREFMRICSTILNL